MLWQDRNSAFREVPEWKSVGEQPFQLGGGPKGEISMESLGKPERQGLIPPTPS